MKFMQNVLSLLLHKQKIDYYETEILLSLPLLFIDVYSDECQLATLHY